MSSTENIQEINLSDWSPSKRTGTQIGFFES